MSLKAIQWAKAYKGDASTKEVLVWLSDAGRDQPMPGGNGRATQCWPSQKKLAELSRRSIPTVQRALHRLNVEGRVLSKFTHGHGGHRKHSRFFLNIHNEPADAFAKRCGITWRARPKHHCDGKADADLPITVMSPTHHSDVASSLNPKGNRKRERAKERFLMTELPANWELPGEWIEQLQEEFAVTTDQLKNLGQRFHNHYRNIATGKSRKQANWPAKFRHWCLTEKYPMKAAISERRGDVFDEEAWRGHVEFWRTDRHWNPRLGPEPDQPGCRAPRHILESVGITQSQRAA